MNYGVDCLYPPDNVLWIGHCNYSGAYHVLQHIYGSLKVIFFRLHFYLLLFDVENRTRRIVLCRPIIRLFFRRHCKKQGKTATASNGSQTC